jgi:hypothetical protein
MSDFERELENELHRVIDPMLRATIPPRRVATSGGTMKRILGGTGVAIGLKIMTGIAAAAAAIVVAGAGTEIATTGSLNPQDWGPQVVQQVQTCKDSLRASGTRGIGQCVSAFAKQHGKAVSAAHRASGARENGNGNSSGHANSHSTSKGDNGKGHGKPSGVPPTEPPATLPEHTP